MSFMVEFKFPQKALYCILVDQLFQWLKGNCSTNLKVDVSFQNFQNQVWMKIKVANAQVQRRARILFLIAIMAISTLLEPYPLSSLNQMQEALRDARLVNAQQQANKERLHSMSYKFKHMQSIPTAINQLRLTQKEEILVLMSYPTKPVILDILTDINPRNCK